MISDATGNPSLGGTTGVLIAFGGVLGALLFAGLSLAMRPRMATVLIMFGGAIAYVLYANYFHSVAVALTLAVFVGVFANGGVAAFYAISPFVYPTVVRGSGRRFDDRLWSRGSHPRPHLHRLPAQGWMDPPGHLPVLRGRPRHRGVATILLDRTYRGRSENPETPEAPTSLEFC